MATNQISFGGQILPCTVERFPAIKKAARKFRQYNIPGRNGDIFFQDDAYENVIQSYQIYAGDGTYGSQYPWTNLAKYLYLDGYQELKDTYDPDHFRKAVFNGPIDVENSWNELGRATIEFNCRPERFLVEGNNQISYGHQTSTIHLWAVADLSNYLQGRINVLAPTDHVWVVSIPAGTGTRTINFNFPDDGQYKEVLNITAGSEATAGSATEVTTRTGVVTTSQLARDWIVPDIYYDEYPVIELDGVPIGAAAILNNPYMPSNPNIILHNVSSYSSEELAFRINDKTIYIDYNSFTPYYFIDTENSSITCSDTLNGVRTLANNVYMSAGFRLLSGQNAIYTTEYYDAVIIPNWWEL